jgi:hypothetical protein
MPTRPLTTGNAAAICLNILEPWSRRVPVPPARIEALIALIAALLDEKAAL